MSWTTWSDQNQLDRTDWPKEDGFYNIITTQMVLIIPPIEKIQTWIHEGFTLSAMILGKKLYLNSRSKLVVRPSPQFFPLFYINLLIWGSFLNKEARLKELKESRLEQ